MENIFLRENIDGGNPVLNIDTILSILSSADDEELHYDVYETLSLLDYSYYSEIDKFADIVGKKNIESIAKRYSLDALDLLVHDPDEFCRLVAPGLNDADEAFRSDLVNSIAKRKCACTDPLLSGLISVVKSRTAYFAPQCRALSLIVKYIGPKNAIRKLLS